MEVEYTSTFVFVYGIQNTAYIKNLILLYSDLSKIEMKDFILLLK